MSVPETHTHLSPTAAAVSRVTEADQSEHPSSCVPEVDELDALTLPTKPSSKPRVRRRRLCELSDSEIWRCMHCGKCYSKTSKAAILEHSRSSCQRKIAEDAEIKRQIDLYFRGRQYGAHNYHLGMNVNMSMHNYPNPSISARMNSAPTALYGNYSFQTSNMTSTPAAMAVYGAGNAANAYAMLTNHQLASNYQPAYEPNSTASSIYSQYSAQLPAEVQLAAHPFNGTLKYSSAHTAQHDMSPPQLTSLSSDSSSVSSLSPSQAGKSSLAISGNDGVHGGLTANLKMSPAQINQMNFITPAHASRSIHSVPSEVSLASAHTHATAASTSVSAPTSGHSVTDSNSIGSSPASPSESVSSTEMPAAKRLRVAMHPLPQQQHVPPPQMAVGHADYASQLPSESAYVYQRQTIAPRFNTFRGFGNVPSSGTVAAAMLPSNIQLQPNVHGVSGSYGTNESLMSVLNYRQDGAPLHPSASYPPSSTHPSANPALSNNLSAGVDVCSAAPGKSFSLLQPRSAHFSAFNRSTIRADLLANAITHNQWPHYP